MKALGGDANGETGSDPVGLVKAVEAVVDRPGARSRGEGALEDEV